MGHQVNPDRQYRLLQRRLDRNVTGAPASPTLIKILKLLYSSDEAELARRLPSRPVALDTLSRRLGIPADELDGRLTEMARRGLVVDLAHDGRRYFTLAPVVIGFFEMTFMRVRDDLPMAELARLFAQYATEDERFVHSVFRGQTQVGRSLVREEALPEGDHTEILDWERASRIVQSASAAAVSLCACRHHASHLGTACDAPQRVCLTLNYAAETMVRNGNAEPLTTAEAMDVLQQSKEAGLAQTGDNVQRKVTFICNCCGCCCGMFQAVKRCDIRNAIVTSNWTVAVDPALCKGCGKCVEACPVDAIELVSSEEGDGRHKVAVRDETLCLGCGVCYSACKFGAISMTPRDRRVLTPETLFDRFVAMAIERGKLASLLFSDPERLSHRALGRIFAVLEKSPPFKALMAIKPLRSAFMNTLVRKAKSQMGELTDALQ